MSALSINSIAAPDSGAQSAASSTIASAAGDTSPFAALLAAIAAADPALQPQPVSTQIPAAQSPQTPAANDDDLTGAVAPTDGADDQTAVASQPPTSASDNVGNPKTGGKPDKKTNSAKDNDPVATQAPLPAQALTQAQILAALPAPVLPVAATAQTPAATDDTGDDDTIAGIGNAGIGSAANATPAGMAGANPVIPPAVPGAAATSPASLPAQSGGKDIATASPPSSSSQAPVAANDDGDNSDVLGDMRAAGQAAAHLHIESGKFAAARPAAIKPASAPSPTAQTTPQASAVTDEDADTAPSTVTPPQAATLVANVPDANAPALQALEEAPQNSVATAGKPAGNKPDNRAADPANAAQDNSAAPGNKAVSQNFSLAQTTSADGSDSKPAHTAQTAASQVQPDTAQPTTPQPGAHIATDAVPQAPNSFSIGGSNAANGLTLSVHVANHDSDAQAASSPTATPNTDALAVSIAARSMSGAKQFDIRLDPPELGRVEVRLSIDASGKTQAHMTADQPQTLALLQKDAPSLTRALRDAGLDVSQSGLNFSLKGQGQNQGQNQGGNSGTPSRSLSLPAMTQGIEATQSAGTLSSSLGSARLDIHV